MAFRKREFNSTFHVRIFFFVLIFLLSCFFPRLPLCEENHVVSGANRKVADRNPLFTERGFFAGIGRGSLPEGHYVPFLVMGHFGVDLKNFAYFDFLKGHRGTLIALIEPHFSYVSQPNTDFECGVGLGLKYMYPLHGNLHGYVLGILGPSYISIVTQEQANGLLFSESFGVGMYVFVGEKCALNIGYRIRHLSNAGFSKPNGGIDVHLAVVGYSVFF
ncbi:MAG: acyloxyacyl hydrolase [Syntrophales bacterium]|nr:acyloxyacyl hydrolase [Syntrophales bacterium]